MTRYRSKYRAKPTPVMVRDVIMNGEPYNGLFTFDSKREARRFEELLVMQRAGAIEGLELQPRFPLTIPGYGPILIRSRGYPNGRQAVYYADFRYYLPADEPRLVVEDAKGVDTPLSRFKRALVECLYGIRVEVV